MKAWHIAITPIVLVSINCRIRRIGMASKAPTPPMPALLTSTSICPAASTNAAMLSCEVTSSGRIRSRFDEGRIPPDLGAASWPPHSSPFQGRSQPLPCHSLMRFR
jgi:hypothetical protein